jgi:16S rRNA (cytidine1402-2'-O)-methyltransferase
LPGTLYVVATPIGNLEDISYRAVRILGEVDLIACEDTRQTRKLLDRYSIAKPLEPLHEHNERDRAPELARRMAEGLTVALASDAGTPLVSDPGYRVVREAIAAGVPVVPVPGASAVLAALAASGLPTDEFAFLGFLPPKAGARRAELESRAEETRTLVYFEAPHRMLDALADLAAALPRRPVVVARELTKLHEEFLRGTAEAIRATLAARPSVQGEFAILIGRAERSAEAPSAGALRDSVARRIAQGSSKMEAIKATAREFGLPKGEVYRAMEE